MSIAARAWSRDYSSNIEKMLKNIRRVNVVGSRLSYMPENIISENTIKLNVRRIGLSIRTCKINSSESPMNGTPNVKKLEITLAFVVKPF